MPSLISIVASVAMKASLVLLAVAEEELLLLFLLINIFPAKAAPAVPALRGCLQTPTQPGCPALGVSALDWAPEQRHFPLEAVHASTAIPGYDPSQAVSRQKQRNHFSTSDLPSTLNGQASRRFH